MVECIALTVKKWLLYTVLPVVNIHPLFLTILRNPVHIQMASLCKRPPLIFGLAVNYKHPWVFTQYSTCIHVIYFLSVSFPEKEQNDLSQERAEEEASDDQVEDVDRNIHSQGDTNLWGVREEMRKGGR